MPRATTIPALFVELWSNLRKRRVVAYRERWLEWLSEPSNREASNAAIEALRKTRTIAVPKIIRQYLEAGPNDQADRRKFLVARVIDEVFGSVHPRVVREGGGIAPDPPLWLQKVRLFYYQSGYFHMAEDGVFLVPASPLAKGAPRVEIEPGGLIDTYFYFLQCVPGDNGLSTHVVLVPDPAFLECRKGVRVDGPIRVAIVPFATDSNHLSFELTGDGKNVKATQTAEASAALIETLNAIVSRLVEEKVHIAVMPELVVGLPIARELARRLSEKNCATLRIVVAGSGMGPEGEDPRKPLPQSILESTDRQYNTSFAFSGRGALLWGQSKMYPYTYVPTILETIGLGTHRSGIAEHAQLGAKLVVFDGTLGRCVTLICEDLSRVYTTDLQPLVRTLRPEWIFHPVLDRSIEVGRWYHQDAWTPAKKFHTNILTVNSVVIEKREGKRKSVGDAPGIALLVAQPGNQRQRVRRLFGWDGVHIVTWRPEEWPESNISVKVREDSAISS